MSLIPTLKTSVDSTVLSATFMLCCSIVCLGTSVQESTRCKDLSLSKLPSFSCFPSTAPFLSTCRITFSNKTGVGFYIILGLFPPPKHYLYFEPFPFLKDFWSYQVRKRHAVLFLLSQTESEEEITERNRAWNRSATAQNLRKYKLSGSYKCWLYRILRMSAT